MRFFSLSSGHSCSVEDAVAGINDHAVADREPRGNRGKTARSPQQGHRPQFCAAGSHDEDVPTKWIRASPSFAMIVPAGALFRKGDDWIVRA